LRTDAQRRELDRRLRLLDAGFEEVRYDIPMGLDGVELVMEVEDRFGVRLPDAECSRIRTVADLAALVVSRLPRCGAYCPTARAFLDLRRLLVVHASIDRNRIRPKARLDWLFPHGLWRTWRRLRLHEPVIPPLIASPMTDQLMVWASGVLLLLWFTSSAALAATQPVAIALMIPLATLAVGIWAFRKVGDHLRRRLPAGIETVGDLASEIAPVEVASGTAGQQLLLQQRVLEEVRRLTAEQLGLPLEQVRPDSDFVNDLEID